MSDHVYSRYEKVPAFGDNPMVDYHLLKRMRQPKEVFDWGMIGAVAMAAGIMLVVIACFIALFYI